MTVTSAPGKPRLTVVGLATSVSRSADGWVVPAEIQALRSPGAPATAEMLYRFRSAGTAAAVSAGAAAVTRALPAGAVTGTQSYLSVRAAQRNQVAVYAPFVVAFAIIGLVMSVLIVANVVSGAVIAGYHRIGILKSIGFTPGQVVAAYTGQVTVPAVVRLPRRRGARQPAVGAAAPQDRGRLRGRAARRAGMGERGRAARHVRPGRAGRGAARAPGRSAERDAGPRQPVARPRTGRGYLAAPPARPAARCPGR